MKRPTPLDEPRDFRVNEMFFSTTDRKGAIRSGNAVFARVSGYGFRELLGQPHNLIRHPAMPRAVFRLVWDHLLRGLPVAGLVKNMAKDGRHYWVVAFLMPIEGGHLSVRFKPTSALLPLVEQLYGRMTAREAEGEARGEDRKAGMDAAEKILLETLRGHGFESYDGFMRTMLHDELKSRDAELARQRLALFPETLPAGTGEQLRARLAAIYAGGRRAYAQVNALYARLDQFAHISEELCGKSAFVLGLTRDFRFIAFNAALRASRLGEEARSLSVIAEYLGTASDRTTKVVSGLTGQIGTILGKLRAVIFNLAAARLQIEMVLTFCAELAADAGDERDAAAAQDRRRMIEDLQRAFAETMRRAVGALIEIEHELRGLAAHNEETRRMMLTLQVAQVGGLVEAQRLAGDDSFGVMFADLREGVEKTKRELAALDDIGDRLAALANEAPAIEATIAQAVAEMGREVGALAETTAEPAAKTASATKAAAGAAEPEPEEAVAR